MNSFKFFAKWMLLFILLTAYAGGRMSGKLQNSFQGIDTPMELWYSGGVGRTRN